ncbi:NUDIX domain-containing protein [Paenibacillus cremeus]|uniref:NUDIX domain-containing protein n=1 Tax=Paenibacillus cremeus TaxID=2163881 RepID=A0A559KE28_9BACL|nr:NUDIX domain-containing protein [Paenibacillus cremeus]TVY10363.1 NUDIX domain-containing protein [Paenibacillus cremeus]
MEAKFYYKNAKAPVPNKPTSIGVVALIRSGDSVLLEKRMDSDRWAIIGGAIHLDESLVEGLIREVKEETGLKVQSVNLFGTFSDPSRIIAFPDGNVKRIITIAYEVEVEAYTELVCSEESRELRFIPREQLDKINIAETHIPIIQAYLENMSITLE